MTLFLSHSPSTLVDGVNFERYSSRRDVNPAMLSEHAVIVANFSHTSRRHCTVLGDSFCSVASLSVYILCRDA